MIREPVRCPDLLLFARATLPFLSDNVLASVLLLVSSKLGALSVDLLLGPVAASVFSVLVLSLDRLPLLVSLFVLAELVALSVAALLLDTAVSVLTVLALLAARLLLVDVSTFPVL